MIRFDNLFFQNAVLEDDQGWIFNDPVSTTMLSGTTTKSDFFLFKEQDYGAPNGSSLFYSMNFYMNKPYDKIERSYMKIQNLGAIKGGFLIFTIVMANFLTSFFNVFKRNEAIYDELFEYSPKKEKRMLINLELN